MKIYWIIILILVANNIFAQEIKRQARFTEFRTAKEIESGQWKEKISTVDTLKNYIVQLVTSNTKDDDWTQWICLQIIEKETGNFTQEIDLTGYEHNRVDRIEKGDFNFDGYEDFSLPEGMYPLDNISDLYFLFDPKTKTFGESGFFGTNLEFNSVKKTITSYNRCCAGTEERTAKYKLIDNRMVLFEQHCLRAKRDDEGNPLYDQDGDLEMEEVDCNNSEK